MLIADVQIVRKIVLGIAILIGILMFALTSAGSESGTMRHEMIEWTGIVAIVICILGRTWCSLYISGRKIEQFVTIGPYSVSRNPLYFFPSWGRPVPARNSEACSWASSLGYSPGSCSMP